MANSDQIGFASIWAGLEHQDTNIDLLKDLCGVDFYDVDFQECSAAPKHELERVSVLARRLSYGECFSEEVCRAAESIGLDRVAWLAMQLNSSFDPNKSRKPVSEKVRFLGVFRYEDDD